MMFWKAFALGVFIGGNLGFRNIGVGSLCLALYPDRKQIIPFYTVEEAYQFYQSISSGKGAVSK